jgi:hypothetical protein
MEAVDSSKLTSGIVVQKIVFFIVAAVRTSNPEIEVSVLKLRLQRMRIRTKTRSDDYVRTVLQTWVVTMNAYSDQVCHYSRDG